jgi:hypothetical protein
VFPDSCAGDPCTRCHRTESDGARFRQQRQHGSLIRYAACVDCETAYRRRKRCHGPVGSREGPISRPAALPKPAPEREHDSPYRRDPAHFRALWESFARADEGDAADIEPYDYDRASRLRDRAANGRGLIRETYGP